MSQFSLSLLRCQVISVMHVLMFSQICRNFTDFGVEFNVDMLLLVEHDGILEMEMQQDNHFSVARLVKCMLDVVVKDVDLVATNTRVLESIDMRFKHTTQPFLSDVGSNVQVLELGISFALINDELVLLDQVCLFFFLGLASLVFSLNVLDQTKGCVQIGAGSVDFTWLLDICASISSEMLLGG